MAGGTKRKQTATKQKNGAGSKKNSKQPKKEGQATVVSKREINVPVDEGFNEHATVGVYINPENGVIYDASMNQTNIGNNNNKFYRLQVLVDKDDETQYYTHARWGRVGEFGQTKIVGPCATEAALKEFEKKFKDKTGLSWEDRSEDPKPKKYTYLEKNYDESDDDDGEDDGAIKDEDDANGGKNAKNNVKSELPMPVQRLMELIFNETHFNSVLEEIGYNADRLPLGKLGESTLKKGFEHLRELASLIKHPSLSQNKYGVKQAEAIEDFSNKYYSTIPHVFGRSRAPMIDNDDILRREVAMLDTLTDMEVANSIMKAPRGGGDKSGQAKSVSLIDQRFQGLNLDEMTPLEHSSSEYKELSRYLIESSGATHHLRYRLQDVFRIERRGEAARFENSRFARLKDRNRRLLWHGSRTTNFGGILSQGLRIAPPEAPVNGYAFGKGVYMADCSSKSANYCIAGMSGGTGLLLLCETELSNPMYEIPTGDSNAQSEAERLNCISTLGVGRTVPQAWKDAGVVHENLRGVRMPDGEPGQNKNHNTGYLQYNEYIAYDVAQIRLRYLFRVGMN